MSDQTRRLLRRNTNHITNKRCILYSRNRTAEIIFSEYSSRETNNELPLYKTHRMWTYVTFKQNRIEH